MSICSTALAAVVSFPLDQGFTDTPLNFHWNGQLMALSTPQSFSSPQPNCLLTICGSLYLGGRLNGNLSKISIIQSKNRSLEAFSPALIQLLTIQTDNL